MEFWGLLEKITTLDLVVKKENHLLKGKAEVKVTKSHDFEGFSKKCLLFKEKGVWLQDPPIDFFNSWLWEEKEGLLRLFHLRQKTPVHLFDFDLRTGIARKEHLCALDCYQAQIMIENNRLKMHCKIDGPKKKEEIFYTYSPSFSSHFSKGII